MRITTGLEIVKENLLKNEMGVGYVQDAIDYILYLETEIDTLKEQLEYADEVINSLDKEATKWKE